MLINITGMDGCGKGTQVALLKKYFNDRGHEVEITKAYDELEKELFSAYIEYASQIEIMFLFQAFHTKQRIASQKALDQGKIVLADRWDETYFGYHNQYGFLSKDGSHRKWLNDVAYSGLKPDISFLLEVEPTIAVERCKVRGADFFDRKSISHHKTLRDEYERIAKSDPDHWKIICGRKSILEVHKEITSHLQTLIVY